MKKPCILFAGLSGESVFLRIPRFVRPGETMAAESLSREPGGKAYNQAVAAARLGAESRLITALGRDASGENCLARLQQEQVQCRPFLKDQPTAFAAIHTAADGENEVTVFRGASSLLSARDLQSAADFFVGADMLVLTCEVPEEAFFAAFDMAEKHQVPVLLNPAPYHPMARQALSRSCLITPNEGEAAALLDLPPDATLEQLAQSASASGLPLCITLGSKGALLCINGNGQFLPAPSIQAVDTTGAGDAFSAALAVRLSMGDAPKDAAAYAVRYASQSTMRPCVLDSYPYASDMS